MNLCHREQVNQDGAQRKKVKFYIARYSLIKLFYSLFVFLWFTLERDLLELGDIKEEEEDYEKDILPLIGFWEINLEDLITEQSLNGRLIHKTWVKQEYHLSSSEDQLFGSDDDGVGLGEPTPKPMYKTIGELNLNLEFQFGKDNSEILNKIIHEVSLISSYSNRSVQIFRQKCIKPLISLMKNTFSFKTQSTKFVKMSEYALTLVLLSNLLNQIPKKKASNLFQKRTPRSSWAIDLHCEAQLIGAMTAAQSFKRDFGLHNYRFIAMTQF